MRSTPDSNDRMNVPAFAIRKQASRALRRPESGQQLAYQCDVAAHGFLFRDAVQLRPGFVLGGADEVEEAGLGTFQVAFRTLLVERVELQQGVVVRTLAQSLDVLGGLVELAAKIGHGADREWLAGKETG